MEQNLLPDGTTIYYDLGGTLCGFATVVGLSRQFIPHLGEEYIIKPFVSPKSETYKYDYMVIRRFYIKKMINDQFLEK